MIKLKKSKLKPKKDITKRTNRFEIGDMVSWHTKNTGEDLYYYGVIIYRYCDVEKMKSFIDENSRIAYDKNSDELKQFYINEIVQIDSSKVWKLDDRYIILVNYTNSSSAKA